MVDKKLINSKTVRIGIVVFLVTFIVSMVIITVVADSNPVVEDNYFVSDETKTSITLTPNSDDTGSNQLIETHIVYTYDGDRVSGLKTYFEYPNEDIAKNTLESIKGQPEFKDAVVQGRYIVVAADESQYKGLTASDVKQQEEALKSFQANQKNE